MAERLMTALYLSYIYGELANMTGRFNSKQSNHVMEKIVVVSAQKTLSSCSQTTVL